MPILYIITGPSGVGKSTISQKLSQNVTNSVLIEGDNIYHQVVNGYISPWKPGNHLNIFWDVCLNMIDTYLSNNFNVIFNYIISLDKLKIIKNKFKNCTIKFIVLTVNEQILQKRDKKRPIDCQMGKRCLTLLRKFRNTNYNQNNILDTSFLSVDESVNIIKNDSRFILK